MKVSVVKNILEANDRIAEENRAIFDEKNLLVFNLMSSPGAGKTSLLEKTIDILKDEATEDVFRLAGVSAEDGVLSAPLDSLKRRLPWLLVNLATAFIAAWVVSLFSNTITEVVALAFLMPVVAGMGGNAATQTLAVVVRGLALGELNWTNARQALVKEGLVGLGNGLALGLVAVLGAWLLADDWALGAIEVQLRMFNKQIRTQNKHDQHAAIRDLIDKIKPARRPGS